MEKHWPEIKNFAELGKFDEIEKLIKANVDLKSRVALYRFAIRSLATREWKNKTIDPLISLGDAAIETALQAGETDEANIICYNMSTNLASVFDDGFHREKKHYQKGLDYAERAIEYRKQLQKGPFPFFLAYWAKGAHLMLLGDLNGAVENFKESLKFAKEAAKNENKPTTVTAGTTFPVLLASGYLSIAQTAVGYSNSVLEDVIKIFEAMKSESEDAQADAEIGLKQLLYVRSKM